MTQIKKSLYKGSSQKMLLKYFTLHILCKSMKLLDLMLKIIRYIIMQINKAQNKLKKKILKKKKFLENPFCCILHVVIELRIKD